MLLEKYSSYKNKYIGLKNQIGGVYDKKVLILCHNKPVTGTFEPLVLNNHWYGADFCQLFQKLFTEYKLSGTPEFHTVDIDPPPRNLPGATYQADAFSDEFIDAHLDEYDLVLVPDCGGDWYKLQSGEDDEKKSFTLIQLSIRLTKIVKRGGLIHFGKFLYNSPCTIEGREFSSLVSALNFYLEKNGFTSTIKEMPMIGASIVAIKN